MIKLISLLLLSTIASAGLPPNSVTGQTYVQKNGVNSINVSQVPLTTGVTGILPYANGGTNAGTAWTQGSVIFAGASGFAQDNANFQWDDTHFTLGLGTAPTASNTLSLVLPSALPATSNGINLTQSGIVAPLTTTLENFYFTTDTTGYASAASLYGVNSFIEQQKTGSSVATYGENVETIFGSTVSANSQSYSTTGGIFESAFIGAETGTATSGSFNNLGVEGKIVGDSNFTTSGTNTVTDIGVLASINATSDTSSAGTLNHTSYGVQNVVAGAPQTAHLTSTAYGDWVSVTGAGTNWDFYGSSGKSYFKGPVGVNQVSPVATIDAITETAATKGIQVKETASQSADMLDILNSSGVAIDSISAAGNVGIATAAATAGVGLNYALPAASSAATTGTGINETGVVFPATTVAQSISLTSDTTAYSAQSGNLVGVNVNLTNSKPDTTNNGSVQTTGFSAVVTNSAAINTAATNTSYGTYGSGGEAIESGAVSGSTNGAAFYNYGGEFTAAATATFSTANSNSVTNRGVSAIAENTVSSKATAGSVSVTDIGALGEVFGSTGSFSTSTGYGVYASASGDTTNYDFYSASGNPSYFSGLLEFNTHLYATQTGSITVTSCGTGSAVTSDANDVRGNISVGTLATSCQVNFIAAYLSVPYCVITPTNSTASGLYVSATTMSNFTVSGSTVASASFNYQCIR